jgi:hypothetical protein
MTADQCRSLAMGIDLKIDLEVNGAIDLQGVLDTINFPDWRFYPEQDEKFKKTINEAIENVIRESFSEAFRNVLTAYPPTIAFDSNGESILVSVNLGSSRNDGWIYFRAQVEEVIDDLIEDSRQMEGGDEAKTSLAQCLRLCALKLETAAKEK